MYHIVGPAKYRRIVFSENVDLKIKEVCMEIEKRYEIKFLEIGTERDHMHLLVQSVPKYSPTKIVQIIKSITAKKVFESCPEVKKKLWGGEFWGSGYYIATVGKHGNEEMISNYVRNQGRNPADYQKIHEEKQLALFD
jgi:putative transposase